MIRLPLILCLLAATALCSCTDPHTGDPIDPIDLLADNIGQQPSQAADSLGFNATSDYPSRDTSYDSYLAEAPGLSQETLNRLFYDVAMPQSLGAMTGLLGYPIAEDGDVMYWAIDGGSSELAVFYEGDTAYTYTVGY